MEKLPEFKYNPTALKLGVIKKENTNCPVCEKKKDYVYTGPFYTTENVEGICPWCIKDGSASEKYNGEFQDSASCEPVDSQELLMELITKTPGYVGWQQEQWLSHCGDFCAIKAYVGWTEIAHLKEELKNDIDQVKSDYNLTQNELETYLVNNGGMQGYLFKCLHCGQHRFTVDMN